MQRVQSRGSSLRERVLRGSLRLSHRLRGRKTCVHLARLEDSQWWTPEQIRADQWSRLTDLLYHAFEHAPYYRALMLEHGLDPARLVRERALELLPTLDKGIIRERPEDLIAERIDRRRFRIRSTSGTTGAPLRFYDDWRGVEWVVAASWRCDRWCGVDLGDRRAYFTGYDFEESLLGRLSREVKTRLWNICFIPAWQLSQQNAGEVYSRLRRFQPRLLVGYAGVLFNWARLLGPGSRSLPGLRAIIASAEVLHDHWRELLESTFGVPVFNQYSGRDIKLVAHECAEHHGMHVMAENCLVEVVRDGKPVAPGEVGEIAVTRLDNWVMPLIRYRVGDRGSLSSEPCACGRGLPLLASLEGRVQDTVVGPRGVVLSGLFFCHLMKDCADVREFRVHQTERQRVVFDVVLSRPKDFPSRERIARVTRDHLGPDVQIDFRCCEALPQARNGKLRLVVSHLGEASRQGEWGTERTSGPP